jgi:hypothetical protein
MKYTIIGCITKYGVEQIRPFIESIERSGFNGDKLMLVYEITQDTIEYLNVKGWKLIQSEPQQHIILQRFRDMYQVLHQYETDVIIWVDVKDIVFQKDPTEWLNKNMNKDILAFSESLKFGDEEWARLNAGTSFPMEWDWLQNEEICCAGTIVGKKDAIRDLFIDIYRWSLTTSNREQLADQAAYNILIRLHQFKDKVQFVKQQEGFAAQLHLKLKKGDILPYTEKLPTIDGSDVRNLKGEL